MRTSKDVTAEIQGYEASQQAIRKEIAELKAELDRRISEHFSADLAAIRMLEGRISELDIAMKPLAAERKQAWRREKLAKLTLGTEVVWEQAVGWKGKRDIRVKVLHTVGEDSVRIDIGDHAFFGQNRHRTVRLDSIRLIAKREEETPDVPRQDLQQSA